MAQNGQNSTMFGKLSYYTVITDVINNLYARSSSDFPLAVDAVATVVGRLHVALLTPY